jgi:hypothetical protein
LFLASSALHRDPKDEAGPARAHARPHLPVRAARCAG